MRSGDAARIGGVHVNYVISRIPRNALPMSTPACARRDGAAGEGRRGFSDDPSISLRAVDAH